MEEKHGHWIRCPDAIYNGQIYAGKDECSVCGKRVVRMVQEKLEFLYCPFCGSKLDEPRVDEVPLEVEFQETAKLYDKLKNM